jgi:hypothetical protein
MACPSRHFPGRVTKRATHPVIPLAKKPNYGFQKHMKELARKQKKEEKRQQRRDAAAAKREDSLPAPVDGEPEAEQE